MVWSRILGRDDRGRRRPRIESLEGRTLLSLTPAAAEGPALVGPVTAGVTVPSGSVNFDQIIGASATRAQYGVDGTGQAVAVIDTGVDYKNEDLGDGFGPGHKVVATVDFADGVNGANDPTDVGQPGHGTAVAGLIAGSDPNDPGVAPGANIVALRALGSDPTFTDVYNALEWILANHAQYNITVVNMSISDGNNYTSNWLGGAGGVGADITTAISQLDALNIPVVVAAGNAFSGAQGMGFPAIDPDTISVTSTDGSGNIVSSAQRLGSGQGGTSATDIAAPGQDIFAPEGDASAFANVAGTSFAAPQVSGAIVLLQQIYQQRFGTLPTVAQVDSWIQRGGDPIHDATTGITIGQLDIPKAAALIPAAPGNPAPPPPTAPPSPPVPPPPPPPPPPAVVKTEVFVNGQDLGAVTSTTLDGGWSAFLSLFTGGITSIQSWTTSGAAVPPTPIPIKGATITTIQGWTISAPTAPPPQTAGTIDSIAVNDAAPPTVTITPRLAGRLHHAVPVHHAAVAPHMTRAWDSGFAGHRRHR
jgi:type VI secretion system secreted protein VgrG